ncbi:MAG: Uma2 family endonuclease [Symploca sp. SIO1C4]|uniref:Uma2 family endonuclease n=1 Tax=Symploca sp. SIO1C4 TaxID=2607765 RepID=A0A6B3NGU8_9CYAN|nr:Uma2 family endonuclease [Symploca sp. SIO1C4]NET03544.1 Uma2 family endonuclease [Symploca sp. SIO2B6]
MVQQLPTFSQQEVIYPDSDGQPMADNTKQFNSIVKIKENLEILFANEANVFVAGDLLWYPVEGDNKIRKAPDVMVIFGRPKGDRGSYQQWLEDNIAPQVVFEILSPGNTLKEMAEKLEFYDQYGVEEYYLYDPDKIDFNGWLRSDNRLKVINPVESWVSPRLGVRFELTEAELEIYRPDGNIFLTSTELAQQAQQAQQQAQQERQRAEQAEARIQILETRLRELGVDTRDL